jgi:hypothetical protein
MLKSLKITDTVTIEKAFSTVIPSFSMSLAEKIQIGWNAVPAPEAEIAWKVRHCSFRVGVCCDMRFCIAQIALDKLLL